MGSAGAANLAVGIVVLVCWNRIGDSADCPGRKTPEKKKARTDLRWKQKTKKRIRIIGLILFIGYLLALTYFLFFAESYGRTVADRQYSYNLMPFLEIRAVLAEPGSDWKFRRFYQSGGKCAGFVPFWLLLPMLTAIQEESSAGFVYL